MSEWYYAKENRQLGPVTSVSLRQLIANGSVRPTDLVWRQGMVEWAQVRSVPELAANAWTAAPAAARVDPVLAAPPADDDFVPPQPAARPFVAGAAGAQGHPSQVGYFSPQPVGERARQTLKGFAPPLGPQDESPLSITHLAQLRDAAKQHKTIRACATFFQSLCGLYVLGGFVCGIVLALDTRGVFRRVADVSLASSGVLVGLAVLAFVARGAVLRCRIWAPITFLVLFGAGLVINVVGIAMNDFAYGSFNSRNGGVEPMVGMITMAVITALFAWPCVRALQAIPRFRAAPLWAQEAVVYARL
jgi:hypothetical protein